MTEQLALDEILGNTATVDDDEGVFFSVALSGKFVDGINLYHEGEER